MTLDRYSVIGALLCAVFVGFYLGPFSSMAKVPTYAIVICAFFFLRELLPIVRDSRLLQFSFALCMYSAGSHLRTDNWTYGSLTTEIGNACLVISFVSCTTLYARARKGDVTLIISVLVGAAVLVACWGLASLIDQPDVSRVRLSGYSRLDHPVVAAMATGIALVFCVTMLPRDNNLQKLAIILFATSLITFILMTHTRGVWIALAFATTFLLLSQLGFSNTRIILVQALLLCAIVGASTVTPAVLSQFALKLVTTGNLDVKERYWLQRYSVPSTLHSAAILSKSVIPDSDRLQLNYPDWDTRTSRYSDIRPETPVSAAYQLEPNTAYLLYVRLRASGNLVLILQGEGMRNSSQHIEMSPDEEWREIFQTFTTNSTASRMEVGLTPAEGMVVEQILLDSWTLVPTQDLHLAYRTTDTPFARVVMRGGSNRVAIWSAYIAEMSGIDYIAGLGAWRPLRSASNFDHPHSMYLSTFIFTGALGLGLLLAIQGASLATCLTGTHKPELRRGCLACICFYSVAFVFDGQTLNAKIGFEWLVFWLPVALTAALEPLATPRTG